MLSTEERSRAYGKKATHGQSSGTDLGNGAGQVVYIHQNNVHGHAFYDPRILRRLHNYAFHYDGWGKQKYKSVQTHTDGPDGGAPWDINLTAPWDYGEVCVKNAASVLDDLILLIMDDEPTRQKAIKFYHDLGITETSSGIKIEDLFQTDSHLWQQNWKQAWKRALAEDKPLGYENLTDAQKDRYHYLVSTGVDPSEALHLAKQKKG